MWKAVEKKFVCNAVIVESPIKTLEETIKNKEWFKGIVLSVTYFEHFGVLKLKEHFKGKIDEGKLNHLTIYHFAISLYLHGDNVKRRNRKAYIVQIQSQVITQIWSNVR